MGWFRFSFLLFGNLLSECKSYNAGMLTALSNHIGDVALLIVIAWIINFGGWNYVFYLDFFNDSFEMSLISLLVVLAATTKSAQIPFSSWLPAAMVAPTPLSALLHSSTLVTVGVYLLIRFSAAFGDWLSSFFAVDFWVDYVYSWCR
jgi:NADH-ubiquinone oxidoreductase chain 5